MANESTSIILPSNPADRKKILDAMSEISMSYTRIESEKSYVKEALDTISKTYNLPKRVLTKLSKVMHKGNFEEEAGNFEDFSDLYETLLGSTDKE